MPSRTRAKCNLASLIERAIDACGGRQQDLADEMGVSQQTVSKLLYGEIPMSAEFAIGIHRASGGVVPGSALRPDLWLLPEHVPLAPSVVPDHPETVGVSASS